MSRRKYAKDEKTLVINELKLEHQGERCQIDHLVLHPHGFVLIESKSISGEVKVNSCEFH